MKNRILLWIIVAALVFSAIIGLQRIKIENSNKTVELAVDFHSFTELAAEGLSVNEIFDSLMEHGINRVALEEWTAAEIEMIAEMGLEVIPYIEIDHVLGSSITDKLHGLDFNLIIFSSTCKDKLPDDIVQTAQLVEDLDARIGIVEFNEPVDISRIASGDNSVRVHEIKALEMKKLSSERIVSRYIRAVKERNIRVLYLRPFDDSDGWERTLDLIDGLKIELLKSGYQLGDAVPFGNWQPPVYFFWIISLGITAGFVLFVKKSYVLPAKWVWAVMVLSSILSGLLLWYQTMLGQQIFALLAAVVFPILAVMQVYQNKRSIFLNYIKIAVVSLAGALLVVGMLGGTDFLIKLAVFRGVKLMHFAPVVVIIGIGLAIEELPLNSLKQIKPVLLQGLRNTFTAKNIFRLALIGLIAAVYLLRTDNFILPVSNIELIMRESLERILYVRPRIKEFMFGHPALVLLLAGEKKHPLLLGAAVVGQLSLVNTFTHIHTPIILSVIRGFYGLVFGFVIGWILRFFYIKLKGRFGDDPRFRILWLS
ncbi:MAG: hypothetical protein GX994_07480 [Firmicutes bacterium]|nr:hypothetical protein [Bacillota bacterium]